MTATSAVSRQMAAPGDILVICTRRLGDVLLATPLIASLKQAWPGSAIDVLVTPGSAPALSGNPDVRQVITMAERAPFAQSVRVASRVFRRYGLAVSTLASDRAHFIALAASARRAGIVPPDGQPGAWKRRSCKAWTAVDLHVTHAVVQYLRLAEVLGIPTVTALRPPQPRDLSAARVKLAALGARYAVVHVSPMFRYKAWPQASWRALCGWLMRQGLEIALTGGNSAEERAVTAELSQMLGAGAHDYAGCLEFPELTPLLQGAVVFVGPDTSVTHLAAACGVPTVGLYGPSNPSAWGPWPQGGVLKGASPWVHTSALQHQGNVWLVQGTHGRFGHCIPCMQEGCERRRDSGSDCLDQLEVPRVIEVLQQVLGDGQSLQRAPV